MGRDVKFLRQAALILPSAFLLDVLLFLLTHGRKDPGFGTYPFFQEWRGEAAASGSPEARFLEQASVFFVPAYALTLLFILAVAASERAVFGRRRPRRPSAYGRAFAAAFPLLLLVSSALLFWLADRFAARQAPGALVAPLLAAASPFAAAAAALLPSAIVAGPFALLLKTGAA
jgi:hypothetical protein